MPRTKPCRVFEDYGIPIETLRAYWASGAEPKDVFCARWGLSIVLTRSPVGGTYAIWAGVGAPSLPATRLPRVAGARVVYRDGVPIATSLGGAMTELVRLEPFEREAAARMLRLDPGLRYGATQLTG